MLRIANVSLHGGSSVLTTKSIYSGEVLAWGSVPHATSRETRDTHLRLPRLAYTVAPVPARLPATLDSRVHRAGALAACGERAASRAPSLADGCACRCEHSRANGPRLTTRIASHVRTITAHRELCRARHFWSELERERPKRPLATPLTKLQPPSDGTLQSTHTQSHTPDRNTPRAHACSHRHLGAYCWVCT
jgi:hypothetical protein